MVNFWERSINIYKVEKLKAKDCSSLEHETFDSLETFDETNEDTKGCKRIKFNEKEVPEVKTERRIAEHREKIN